MQKQGVLVNAYRKGEAFNVIFDSHGLSQGLLQGEMRVHVPNTAYSDGKRVVVIPFETDIRLVAEAGDYCCENVGEICITIPNVTPHYPEGECTQGIPLTHDEIDSAINSAVIPDTGK